MHLAWSKLIGGKGFNKPTLRTLSCIKQGDLDPHKYRIQGNLLFYKGRLHLGFLSHNQDFVLQQYHGSPIEGHPDTQKTHARIK